MEHFQNPIPEFQNSDQVESLTTSDQSDDLNLNECQLVELKKLFEQEDFINIRSPFDALYLDSSVDLDEKKGDANGNEATLESKSSPHFKNDKLSQVLKNILTEDRSQSKNGVSHKANIQIPDDSLFSFLPKAQGKEEEKHKIGRRWLKAITSKRLNKKPRT